MLSTTLATIFSFAMAAAASPIFTSTAMNPQATGGMETCDGIPYDSSTFTCFNGNILCPIAHRSKGRQQLVPCGSDPKTCRCFSPDEYECKNDNLFPIAAPYKAAATGVDFAAPAPYFKPIGTEALAATGAHFALRTGDAAAVHTYPPKYAARGVPTSHPRLMYD